MYPGIDIGKNKAISKILLPGNEKNVVSQAGITPNIKATPPTPIIKINVLSIYSGKSVLITHSEFAELVNGIDINDNMGETNNMLTKKKNIFLNTLKNIH
jgi:hypothetical protein